MDDDSVVFIESHSSDHLPRHTVTITINLNNGRFQSNYYFFTPFNIIFKYGFYT